MFKRKLCPRCLTGEKTLLLDERAPECPFLAFHDGKKCAKFEARPKPERRWGRKKR